MSILDTEDCVPINTWSRLASFNRVLPDYTLHGIDYICAATDTETSIDICNGGSNCTLTIYSCNSINNYNYDNPTNFPLQMNDATF